MNYPAARLSIKDISVAAERRMLPDRTSLILTTCSLLTSRSRLCVLTRLLELLMVQTSVVVVVVGGGGGGGGVCVWGLSLIHI